MLLADGPEEPLVGGDVTEGLVRIGTTVRRPRQRNSDLTEIVLLHLERVGFDGAPRLLGTDAQGRQALSYVAGEVAVRPWPAWIADNERIASVARLVRRFDDAMQSLGVPAGAADYAWPDPSGTPRSIAGVPTFIGHLDLAPENVVFVDQRATALIDFDLVAPADRVSEVGNLLLWWAPLIPPEDRESVVRDVDVFARTSLLVDEYGLAAADRAEIVDRVINYAQRSWFMMRDRAERLGGGWQRMWDEGVGDRIHRRERWLIDNADVLAAAVRSR